MYETLGDKTIKCKFCEFVGEFKYDWTTDVFTVTCPSCGKVNYEVSREKIDDLAQEMIKESIHGFEESKKRDT